MFSMFHERYLSVIEVCSADDFRRQVVKFSTSLGFDTVSATAVLDRSCTHTEFHTVDNMPAAYIDGFNDGMSAQTDPVMQHCKNSSLPILWNQSTYLAADRVNLWEEQASHGLKTGIALAIHLPEDRHFFIGVDKSRPIAKRVKRLTSIVADLQLFAIHAQDAAFRIFYPEVANHADALKLTPREVETLRWTMDGKTAYEVGEALNISERTAVFHLRNAMKKLKCGSKHQAVLKAMRLRLLS